MERAHYLMSTGKCDEVACGVASGKSCVLRMLHLTVEITNLSPTGDPVKSKHIQPIS